MLFLERLKALPAVEFDPSNHVWTLLIQQALQRAAVSLWNGASD